MTDRQHRPQQQSWAPWWHYVVALAVVNAVAQGVGLRLADPITNVVSTVILIVAVVSLMTWLWRRHDGHGYG